MILDDESVNCDIMSAYVSTHFETHIPTCRLELLVQATAREALATLDQLRGSDGMPALLFTDYNLDDNTTGVDIARRVKAICREDGRKTKVVLVSGQSVADEEKLFYRMLLKPVTMQAVSRLIEEAMACREGRQA